MSIEAKLAELGLTLPAAAAPVAAYVPVVIAGGLLVTHVDYPTYFAGAQFIHFLLGPAVVALAWPLWQRRAELRELRRQQRAARAIVKA